MKYQIPIKTVKLLFRSDTLYADINGVYPDHIDPARLPHPEHAMDFDYAYDYCLGESSQQVREIIQKEGLYQDNDILHFDSKPYYFERIHFWMQLMNECYDGHLGGTDLGNEIWNNFFGLGGDDDIDYSGNFDTFALHLTHCEQWGLLEQFQVQESNSTK